MKQATAYKCIGKIKEAHGLRGESYVILFAKSADWLKKAKTLCLGSTSEKAEKEVKFKKTRELSSGLILHFEGVSDRTQAEALINQFIFIDDELLVSAKGETIFLKEILGFEVFDKEILVGVIKEFSSNGPQDLLVVGEKEHLIPFVDAFIREVDFKGRKILMDLPEGLLSED